MDLFSEMNPYDIIKTINCVTFQDRRQGESSKPALVRQEPVKDTEKSAEVATNRG